MLNCRMDRTLFAVYFFLMGNSFCKYWNILKKICATWLILNFVVSSTMSSKIHKLKKNTTGIVAATESIAN